MTPLICLNAEIFNLEHVSHCGPPGDGRPFVIHLKCGREVEVDGETWLAVYAVLRRGAIRAPEIDWGEMVEKIRKFGYKI